jgi:predicted DsbA family dithiol-disulfide isomerase
VRVEVWSDVVCPWCYLGKRRLEQAIERFDGGGEVEVIWRSFQLGPDAPQFGEPGAGAPTSELLEARGLSRSEIEEMQAQLTGLAAEAGLAYRLDRSHHVNTYEAHRLIHAASRQGLEGSMVERLFRAQLIEGLRIDDPEILAQLAREVGLEGPAEATEQDGIAVETDIAEARRLGVSGVPFFLFDGRLAVSGAQPVELLLEALQQARAGAPA